MSQLVGKTGNSKQELRLCSHSNSSNNRVYSTSLCDDGQKLFQNDANLHHRLGHISFTRLSHVPRINVHPSKMDTSICITCPLAKHTQLPLSVNEKSCEIPFGLIHMDIWGP